MAAVDEIDISLRFFGDDLNPDQVTELLRARPSFSSRKGDPLSGKFGHTRTASTGQWRLNRARRRGVELSDEIDALLAGLTGDLTAWRSLGRYGPDIFVGLWMNDTNRMCDLRQTTLRRLTERGLEVTFDIWYCREDDDA